MIKNITIIGCSFSGMLTALALADEGYNVTIIDSLDVESPKFLKDLRTTALTSQSQEFLSGINLWEEVSKIAAPILDVYVVDNKSPSMLHFTNDKIDEESLGYIVQNAQFKRVLLEAVKENRLIRLIDKSMQYEIFEQDSRCDIKLNDKEFVLSDLLILCCGRRSYIYKNYFEAKTIKYYEQIALTFHVHHEKPHEYTAVEHFKDTGPFASLPLLDQNYSSVVWTLPENYANLLRKLPIEDFTYLTQKNFGNFLGKIDITSEIAGFPLQAYLVKKYFYQNIMVIADTAHVVHPLAGQGLNQGIKDIKTLARLLSISNVSKTDLILNTLLSDYENERMNDNRDMYLLTDNINRIFSNNNILLKFGRRSALKLLNNSDFLKTRILKYAMGVR